MAKKLTGAGVTLFGFAMFVASPATAGIITLLDGTDNGGGFTVLSTDPTRTIVTMNSLLIGLGVTLLPPSPSAVVVSDSCPLGQIGCAHLNIGEYPADSNPAFDFESDIFSGHSPDGHTYTLSLAVQTTFPCIAESGCLVREDGLLHTLDTITWSDATIDTINFQSTPEPINFQSTPEPSSQLLTGASLILLGLRLRQWRHVDVHCCRTTLRDKH
jgi:hypothetical protein